MPLIDRISAARQRLRDGSLANEAAVSIGVVLPILDALGWPAFDPGIVAPEYSVGTRRVDFALLTRGTPAVFVEVKQPGLAGHADRQLFEYAFHEGVPIAILTDGATWHVYLPAMQGTYDDRRVYLLDLLERDPADSAAMLRRYLSRDAVESGEAFERAQADYKQSRQLKGAKAAIPQAWANLVSEPRLTDLLAAEVEIVFGFQPEPGDIAAFLAALRPGGSVIPPPRPTRPRPAQPVIPSVQTARAEAPSQLIADLLGTLERIHRDYPHRQGRSISELRTAVIGEIATERGVTPQTVADAHRRRLRPDITGSAQFDSAISDWLSGNKTVLASALVNHAPSQADKVAIERFFGR